jgi:hypothetical protein
MNSERPKMLVPITKKGKRLQGTLERLTAVALVEGKGDDGELVYTGETKIWWEEQETVTQYKRGEEFGEAPEIVWIDEDGDEVLESELTWQAE